MTESEQRRQRGRESKAGLEEGEGAPPPQNNPKNAGATRPTDEEDTYGGAERTQNEDVKSDQAKP